MKCPHCHEHIAEYFKSEPIDRNTSEIYSFSWAYCPNTSCHKIIIRLHIQSLATSRPPQIVFFYPKTVKRLISSDVPLEYKEDFEEASEVLEISPKASAALSRRCLQRLLKENANTTARDLAIQIQEVLDSRILPSQIASGLDAIRAIGNFAAHPLKSTSSGEILDVEPGEAEWSLDVLESLFDFYFVQPAQLQTKRDALNEKLRAAGKPELKQ
jgi:hypothetical protein